MITVTYTAAGVPPAMIVNANDPHPSNRVGSSMSDRLPSASTALFALPHATPPDRFARENLGPDSPTPGKPPTLAQAFDSLFKAECIGNPAMRPTGGWKNVTDVEIAVAEYVDWYNHRRLHGEIGLIPPAESEANDWNGRTTEHYPETPVLAEVGANNPSLH